MRRDKVLDEILGGTAWVIDRGQTLTQMLRWPLWLRRVFLCTLPVSGPLWLIAFFCWLAFVTVAMAIGLAFVFCYTLWTEGTPRG